MKHQGHKKSLYTVNRTGAFSIISLLWLRGMRRNRLMNGNLKSHVPHMNLYLLADARFQELRGVSFGHEDFEPRPAVELRPEIARLHRLIVFTPLR